MFSRFCGGLSEPAAFRERAENGQLIIVPLMIRPSAWTRFPWIAKLEHFPKDGTLSGMSEHEMEVQLTKLMDEVARLVEQQRMDEPEETGDDGTAVESAASPAASAGKAAFEHLDENAVKEMVGRSYGKPALDVERARP